MLGFSFSRVAQCLLAAFLLTTGSQAIGENLKDSCEIHVWGAGRPNFRIRPSLLVKVDPAQLDRTNPLSNVSLFDTVNRARGLSDDDLRRLFSNAVSVSVIRHSDVIDIDQTPLKSLSKRLTPSLSPCYADLIIGNLYAIFPNPSKAWETAGLVGALLAGGDRLVIEFWLRDFSTANVPKVAVVRSNPLSRAITV